VAELDALGSKPESEIDYGDIPQLSDDQWKSARRGNFYRPVKQQITVCVDADVLLWLKAHGKGYQSRINTILRREMLASIKSATAK